MTEAQQNAMEAMDYEMGIVELVSGYIGKEPHYAYALIPPSKYLAFKEAEKAGNYDLADYGEILAHGPGLVPPDDVKKEMAEKYGASDSFEEDVAEAMKSLLLEEDSKNK